jgi:CheY-like chemotaxis protein
MAEKTKILIIDDDPDIVESLRIVLESKSYAVLTAESGADGVKKAVSGKPDLILLDVMLEKIDTGFEVSRELKRIEATRKIPIIMITAIKELPDLNYKRGSTPSTNEMPAGYFDEAPSATDAIGKDSLPVDFFYEKPIKPELLLEKIASLLNKK